MEKDVSKLFYHVAHNGPNYLNGHCFVSIMLCIPFWKQNTCVYLSIPLDYRMWQKDISKIDLAADIVQNVMPSLSSMGNIILLYDSWYVKNNLLSIVEEYKNLDIICNERNDSVLYDLAPPKTGKITFTPNWN